MLNDPPLSSARQAFRGQSQSRFGESHPLGEATHERRAIDPVTDTNLETPCPIWTTVPATLLHGVGTRTWYFPVAMSMSAKSTEAAWT